MDHQKLKRLLKSLEDGHTDIDEVLEKLKNLPYEEMGYAKLDHHRTLRRGFPEAVFCTGKTEEQVLKIAERMVKSQGFAVLTKVEPGLAEAIKKQFGKKQKYFQDARMLFLGKASGKIVGEIAIVTAGTSDIPIAEEAAVLCEAFDSRVKRIYDIGVAGVHRIVPHIDSINASDVVIVVAGMEGALPSVIAGMTDKPVIAVPTSIGYGASFKGITALLGMLCSCSPGIAIVNIDNGFGAGVFALSIIRLKNSNKK